MANWRRQITAWVKEERNYPSGYIWSVENEITDMNVANLGQIGKGGLFLISDFPTSPVPSVFMLSGEGSEAAG